MSEKFQFIWKFVENKSNIDRLVITISKVAKIKFLTDEEVACEIEDDPKESVKLLICTAM